MIEDEVQHAPQQQGRAVGVEAHIADERAAIGVHRRGHPLRVGARRHPGGGVGDLEGGGQGLGRGPDGVEAVDADLLLHVVDGSHPDPEGQISAVRAVLADVDAADVKEIVVVNKADVAAPDVVDRILRHEKHSIAVSARTGAGVQELLELVAEELPKPDIDIEVLVPYARGDLVSRLHDEAEILAEEHVAEGTHLRARVHGDLAAELTPFAAAG